MTSQNTTAAKDEYGVCVQVLDGDQDAYAAGLCERVANCYWEEPREFVERARRYTDAQYETNEHAARYYVQSIIVTYGTLGFVLAAAVFVGCAKFAVRRYVGGRVFVVSDACLGALVCTTHIHFQTFSGAVINTRYILIFLLPNVAPPSDFIT